MKARVKATGEIIEVFQYGKYHFLEYIGEKTGRLFLAEELDLLDSYPDYWERLEHTYAGMAMQGIMSYIEQITPKEGRSFCDEIVDISFEVAHALVEKMKEERK